MIKGVVRTEKALKLATKERTIPFLVDLDDSKPEIKSAIESLYNTKVDSVKTHIINNHKVAYVKFAKDVNVEDLANSLNMV